MVDYSAWLDSQSTWVMPTGRLLIADLAMGVVLGIVLIMFWITVVRPRETTIDNPALTFLIVSRILTVILFVVVGCLTMIAIGGLTEAAATVREPFAAHTERVFGVTQFDCAPTHENAACPTDGLPADRTAVSWLKYGRLVQGVIVVDGTRVGLYDDEGQPVTPVHAR